MRDSNATVSHLAVASTTNVMADVANETSSTAVYVELAQEDGRQRLWNFSKIAVTTLTSEPASALATTLDSVEPTTTTTAATTTATTTTTSTTTTLDPFDEFGPPEGVEYIFVPLGVVVSVIILSAVVLIISRKRKLERLRHRLMPMYNFDPGEEEEDDWETELLDECYNTHQRRQGYRSMDTEETAELFGDH